jgi:hypothetical protein
VPQPRNVPSGQLVLASLSPPPSSAGLVDPYAVPSDLLTPPLDVVPGVSFDAIGTGAASGI